MLLKNDKATALPLAVPSRGNAGLKIAILGELGNDVTAGKARAAMLGSYTSDDGKIRVDSLFTAAANRSGITVTSALGASPDSPAKSAEIDAAKQAAAAAADVAVVVVGDSLDTCGEFKDRSNLDLSGGQMELLEAISQQRLAGTVQKVVLVLVTGRPATFGASTANAVLDGVDAILWAGRPGEEGAAAIWDVILGEVNPSGKLQANWPRSVGHVGSGSSPWLQSIRGKWVSNHRGSIDDDGRRYDNCECVASCETFASANAESQTERTAHATLETTDVDDSNEPTPLFYL